LAITFPDSRLLHFQLRKAGLSPGFSIKYARGNKSSLNIIFGILSPTCIFFRDIRNRKRVFIEFQANPVDFSVSVFPIGRRLSLSNYPYYRKTHNNKFDL